MAWAAEHAPDRLIHSDDVAVAFGISSRHATTHLARMAAAGMLKRWWTGAYSLPGAGPFTHPDAAGDDRIVAFIAKDGGATWGEIMNGTGLDRDTVTTRLPPLLRSGRLVRKNDARGAFYLLPDQEPGQVVTLEPAAG